MGTWTKVASLPSEEVDAFAGVDDGTARFYEETSSSAPAVYKVDGVGITRLTNATDPAITSDCNVPVSSHRAYADAHGGGITACLVPNYPHEGTVVPHVHVRAAPGDVGSAYTYDFTQFDDLLGYSYSSAKFDLSLHAKRGRATLSVAARRGDGYVSGAWRVDFGTTPQGSQITRLTIPVTLSALPSAPWMIFESHTQDRTAICVESQIFIFDNGATSPTSTVQSPVNLNGAQGCFDSNGKLHLVYIPSTPSYSYLFDIETGEHVSFKKLTTARPTAVQPGLAGRIYAPAHVSYTTKAMFNGVAWVSWPDTLSGSAGTTSNGKLAVSGPSDSFYVTTGQQTSGRASEIWRYEWSGVGSINTGVWEKVVRYPTLPNAFPIYTSALVTVDGAQFMVGVDRDGSSYSAYLFWSNLDSKVSGRILLPNIIGTSNDTGYLAQAPDGSLHHTRPTISSLYPLRYHLGTDGTDLTLLGAEKLDAPESNFSGVYTTARGVATTDAIYVFDPAGTLVTPRMLKYSFSTTSWEILSEAPEPLIHRSYSSNGQLLRVDAKNTDGGIAYDEYTNMIYLVWGGTDTTNPERLISAYSIDNNTWEVVGASDPTSTKSYKFTSAVMDPLNAGRLYVAGGNATSTGFSQDTHYVDITNGSVVGPGPSLTHPRNLGGMYFDGSRTLYYISGRWPATPPSDSSWTDRLVFSDDQLRDRVVPIIGRARITFTATGSGSLVGSTRGEGHATISIRATEGPPALGAANVPIVLTAEGDGLVTRTGGDATNPSIIFSAKATAPNVTVGSGDALIKFTARAPYSKTSPLGHALFQIVFKAEMGEGAHVLVTGESHPPVVFDSWGEWRPNMGAPGHALIKFTAWGRQRIVVVGSGHSGSWYSRYFTIRFNIIRPRGYRAHSADPVECKIRFHAVGSWITMADEVRAPIVFKSWVGEPLLRLTGKANAVIRFRPGRSYGRRTGEAEGDATIKFHGWGHPEVIWYVDALVKLDAWARGYVIPSVPRDVVMELPGPSEPVRLESTVETRAGSSLGTGEVV